MNHHHHQLQRLVYRSIAVVAIIVTVLTTSSVYGQQQQYDCSFTADSPVIDVSQGNDGTFVLRHNIHPIDQTIAIELEYSGAAVPVWMGLSFSTNTQMIDNIAIIGLPDDGTVQKHILASKVTSGVTPIDSSTLSDASIQFDGTKTILKFTKLLAETGETTITPNAENIILVALGRDSTFAQHAYRDDRTVTLSNQCTLLADGVTTAPIAPVAPVPVPVPIPVAIPVAAPIASPTTANNIVDLGEGRIQRTISLLGGDLSMILITNSVLQTLTVTMTYAGMGWLAFAISDGDLLMPNSQGVMVFPTSTEGIAEKWDIGNGRVDASVSKVTDATRQASLQDATYTQSATETILTFTKPYIDGDEIPIIVSPGSLNYFIYAVGGDNTFGFHKQRGGFAIDLADTTGGDTDFDSGKAPDTKSLWMVHGILMFISWSILVPLAVCTALLRNFFSFFSNNGNWFQIHRTLNSIAVLCTIAGFGIAVHNIKQEQGSTAEHFSSNRHQTMGLIIFIFAILQAISGIFRPHLPHAAATPAAAPTTTSAPAAGTIQPSEVFADTIEDGYPDSDPPKPSTDATATAEPAAKKSPQRIAFEIQHKLIGTVAMILAWFNVDSGIGFYQSRYDSSFEHLDTIPWVITAAIITVTAVCLIYRHFQRKT